MSAIENVIKDLNVAKLMLCNPQILNPGICIRIGQAITSAIDLLKEQPKWIPVKEKLPDKDGRYLVCDGGDVLEACFSPTGQLRRNQNGGFDRLPSWITTDCYESEDLYHVTHWMPLPKPPEMKRG